MTVPTKRWVRPNAYVLLLASAALLVATQGCSPDRPCMGVNLGGACIPDGVLTGGLGGEDEDEGAAAPDTSAPEEPAAPAETDEEPSAEPDGSVTEPETPAEPEEPAAEPEEPAAEPEEPAAEPEEPAAEPEAPAPEPEEPAVSEEPETPAEPETPPEPEPDPAVAACVESVYSEAPPECKACLCAEAECRPNVVASVCGASCFELLRCIDANCPGFADTEDTTCVLANCAAFLSGVNGAMAAASCAADCADSCR